MADTPIPTISFENDLGYDIIVYDSFGDDETDSDSNTDDTYYGTLTSLGTVTAKSTTAIQPIHKTSAFIVESVPAKKPVKRCTKLGTNKTLTSFTVNQGDEDAMTATFNFIDFYLKNPGDPMSQAFTVILNEDAGSWFADMPVFFAKYPAYANCTFPDYMMAITYDAMNPPPLPPPNQPAAPPTYSLRKLAISMGAQWPAAIPDITVSKFSCTNKNSLITINADIDITTLPFESNDVANNVSTIFGNEKIFTFQLQFNYAFGLGIFGTRISFLPDGFDIPVGNGDELAVTKPTISFDINPLFKFVVFTIKGTIPFDINSKQFDAQLSLAVDNDEAAIGVIIEGDNSSFPPPPGLKGLFFDEFGVGIGVFFKPLACIVGIQGKFHIGSTGDNPISLADDTFALICKITGEAITPAFASFYVPQLDLNTVLQLFTNKSINLDVPVSFEDLSFKWTDNLMAAYVLPDGTLCPSGYGFSAACNIGSFGFYGDMELDLNNGLTADIEVSPINWKNVFQLTGDGKGHNIKIDANGNPIKNNFVPQTQAEKDAVANATQKQITTPGGAVLIINTLSMPILHLNAKASLFDIVNFDITADVNKSGISFELDFGAILTEKMVCNLTDFHNLYGEFGYYIDKSIPLPPVAGVNLGSIPLKADIAAHLSIATTLSDITISTGGIFDFENYHFTYGDFSADINISKISDFVGAIVQYIIDEAKTIFSQLLDTAEHWAAAAAKGIVTGFDDAGKVLKNAYNKTALEMTTILKGAGFAANDIAIALKNGYNAASQDVASLLDQVGFSAEETATAIKNCWNCGIDDVSWAFHYAGLSAQKAMQGVKSAFGALAKDAAATLKKWSYAVNDIAISLKNVYNAASQDIASLLDQVGYSAEEIAGAIKNCWNCGMDDVSWAFHYAGLSAQKAMDGVKSAYGAVAQDAAATLKKWSYGIDDIAVSLKNTYNAAAQDVANIFKSLGVVAQDTANAIKSAYNLAINDTASVLKQAGYAANDVASALQNAFNVSVDAVATAMKAVGYAGDDVKNAFESLGGDFKSFADTAWKTLSDPNTWNPANW